MNIFQFLYSFDIISPRLHYFHSSVDLFSFIDSIILNNNDDDDEFNGLTHNRIFFSVSGDELEHDTTMVLDHVNDPITLEVRRKSRERKLNNEFANSWDASSDK